VHTVAPPHDTPYKKLPEPLTPEGVGVVSTAQAEPFHDSASVCASAVPDLTVFPIATQSVGELHETPTRWLALASAGFGAVSIFQRVPFHLSANTVFLALPLESPTAVQALGEVHDTAYSLLLGWWASFGLGEGWMLQAVPFHASARVTWSPALSVYVPTAVQALAELHDTPLKRFCLSLDAPLGSGTV
jgi:hypothetical protein